MQINLLSALASFVGSPINRGAIVESKTLPLFIGGVPRSGEGVSMMKYLFANLRSYEVR